MMLKNSGLVGSMGRVAAAGNNARMESFHSLLQNNVLDTKKWKREGNGRGMVDSLSLKACSSPKLGN